jgi:hypothetical protein
MDRHSADAASRNIPTQGHRADGMYWLDDLVVAWGQRGHHPHRSANSVAPRETVPRALAGARPLSTHAAPRTHSSRSVPGDRALRVPRRHRGSGAALGNGASVSGRRSGRAEPSGASVWVRLRGRVPCGFAEAFYSRFTANAAELGVRDGLNGRPTQPELPVCTRRHLADAPGHPLKVTLAGSSQLSPVRPTSGAPRAQGENRVRTGTGPAG